MAPGLGVFKMSFTLEDFFDEHVLPKLKELVSEKDKQELNDSADKPSSFEKFMDIIRGLDGKRRSEDFYGWLIDACVNPTTEQMSTHKAIQIAFRCLRDDAELQYIKYKEDGAQVTADYQQEEETEN